MVTDVPTGRVEAALPDASWSDTLTGASEEAAFLGERGSKILAFLHRPAPGALRGGMLMCGSLYEDLDLNYRKEVLVARTLAERGIATVRFQYRGTGNSDDISGGAVTFESMVTDARTALSWLVERTLVARPAFCGFRLGALVAAEFVRRDEHAPLALWAPMASGAEYYRAVSRANRVAGARDVAGHRGGHASTEKQLAEQDAVEMLGHLVYRRSYEDLRVRTLPSELSSERRLLLIHVGLGEIAPHLAALVSQWTSGGATVDVLSIRTRQLWMTPDKWEPEEESPTTRQLSDELTHWAATIAGEGS